ncbi:hypothetical protein GDO78_001477 [Eleutherodactylus coqui]|uniref:Uncharacterized protein n=1 Tax=Eleutherodactylus coqui TaxID=57060 RepID=A0A8J6FTR3_ELECQ|nr:hypothetical protein GDO78_001477 [Eleutherodactylus coqui]
MKTFSAKETSDVHLTTSPALILGQYHSVNRHISLVDMDKSLIICTSSYKYYLSNGEEWQKIVLSRLQPLGIYISASTICTPVYLALVTGLVYKIY